MMFGLELLATPHYKWKRYTCHDFTFIDDKLADLGLFQFILGHRFGDILLVISVLDEEQFSKLSSC